MFSDKKKNEIDENEEKWGGGGGDIWKWGDMSLNLKRNGGGGWHLINLDNPPSPHPL